MTDEPPTSATAVLQTVLDRVKERFGPEPVPISRIEIGTNLVLVAGDDDRLAGVAHRPPVDLPGRAARDAADVIEIASWAVDPPAPEGTESIGWRALGVAALNALSAPHVDWRRGDPMASLSEDVEVVATVGLFRPALDRFDPVELRIVELEPIDPNDVAALDGVAVSTYLPDAADDAFDGVDVLFLTGSAFVYGGAGRYLDLAAEDTSVVVIGPTASFLPGPAFAAGADVIAGARVTDAGAIEESVCGTDLYGRGLEKVYVTATGTVDGLQIDDATSP